MFTVELQANANRRFYELPVSGMATMVESIRMPAVAGSFYPSDPIQLNNEISGYLNNCRPKQVGKLKALIAPHAGYQYSGPVAASAYSLLRTYKTSIQRVVVIGPAHRVRFNGFGLSSASQFSTPLGTIPVDQRTVSQLIDRPDVQIIDQAHHQEHSLEVHLPFLQSTIYQFCILPIVIGNASAEQVADLIDLLWGSDETLFIISTDLSHFHDYATAKSIDEQTCQMIENFDWQRLQGKRACGFLGVAGMLAVTAAKELQVTRLDLRNSGDTSGPKDKVVGYASFAIHERDSSDPIKTSQRKDLAGQTTQSQSPADDPLTDSLETSENGDLWPVSSENQKLLLSIAKQSLVCGCQTNSPVLLDSSAIPAELKKLKATFVTLKIDRQLRGCTGSITARRPLAEDVAASAFGAGFKDPRFEPLLDRELEFLDISISVLSDPIQMDIQDEQDAIAQLKPGLEGYVLVYAERRGVLLPSVWEMIPDPRVFIQQLKQKANLSPNFWHNDLALYRFTSFSFGASYAEI